MPQHEPEPATYWQEVSMLLHAQLSNDHPACIVVRHETVTRLFGTCFRGRNIRLAGNFALWENVEQMFADKLVLREFLAEVLESTRELKQIATFSVTIPHNEEVGWESTDQISKYDEGDHEEFRPNRRSSARRIKLNRVHILAPRTKELTIIYEPHFEQSKGWVTVVRSIYPGRDIGNLKGNVSAREGRVFFDWNHPGA